MTKQPKRYLLSLIFLLTLLGADGVKVPAETSPTMVARMTSDKAVYKQWDYIKLTAEITNTGDKTVNFAATGYGTVRLKVKRDGKLLEPSPGPFLPNVSVGVSLESSLEKIKPGQSVSIYPSYARTIKSYLTEKEVTYEYETYFPEPGKYEVSGFYQLRYPMEERLTKRSGGKEDKVKAPLAIRMSGNEIAYSKGMESQDLQPLPHQPIFTDKIELPPVKFRIVK